MAVKARDSITLTKVVDGSDGRSIVLFQREFYLSTSKTTCTGGAWSTTQPQWTSGKYLWTRNKITYANPSSVEYTTPEVDTTWEAIKDVDAVSELYYEYYTSTSETELVGGSWAKELPDWTKGVYIWIRTTSLMTDGTYKYTEPKLYNVVQDQVEQMLADVESKITSEFKKDDSGISNTVDQMQVLVNDNLEAMKNLRSIVTQHSDSISAETKKILEITNQITGLTTKEEISQWARYEDGVLTLGESNSPFSVKLSTTELGFYESGTRIAYISNQQLHINRAVILEKIQLGTFILEYDDEVGFIIH